MTSHQHPIGRSAEITHGGAYRWRLARRWHATRPMLLVVMFNPSTADHQNDDNTIRLLTQIGLHNDYGGLVVVNLLPLRSSKPADAIAMLQWERTSDWSTRDRLQDNLAVIATEVQAAGDVLLAWGALGANCPNWVDFVMEEIDANLRPSSRLLCLSKTKDGHPLHPMARGKNKVRPDAKLIAWSEVPA